MTLLDIKVGNNAAVPDLRWARQISLSVTMHDDEREGDLAIATNFAEPELSPQRICVTALARFLGNREVFLCPSAEDAQFGGDWVNRS